MTIRLNPHLATLKAYTPGEQLNAPDVVKLNTNECPFAPPVGVLEALHAASGDQARKYPDPTCRPLREAIARDLGLEPNQVLVTNGSDEGLRMIFHAYAPAGEKVAALNPTYSLYPVLGAMFGAGVESHPAKPIDPLPASFIASKAPVKFLANPNPPYGVQYSRAEVERLADASDLLVLDEAYAAFADWDGVPLAKERPNVLVTRTFSKSHGLAGLRVGFVVGPKQLIEQLNVIRDSYNVNAMSQAAALAAWNDKAWLASTVAQVNHLRVFLTGQLRLLGFRVWDSMGNFVFAEHPMAAELAIQLREQRILVRHFNHPGLENGLRISIGTEQELGRLLGALKLWLANHQTMAGPSLRLAKK